VRLRCPDVRVAAAPAEWRSSKSAINAKRRSDTYVPVELALCPEEIFEDPAEFPSDYSKVDSEAEFEAEEPRDNPDEIEPGDRVFMPMVHDPAEFI
jgi:hypothetical protein